MNWVFQKIRQYLKPSCESCSFTASSSVLLHCPTVVQKYAPYLQSSLFIVDVITLILRLGLLSLLLAVLFLTFHLYFLTVWAIVERVVILFV